MMNVGFTRLSRYAAGLTVVIAAAVTGCASTSSTAAAPQVSPLKAVQLAAYTSSHANTFTGTMDLHMAVKPGTTPPAGVSDTTMVASFAEQLHPSLLASVDITSLTSQGSSLAGGMTEIISPTEIYLKIPSLTQPLHLTKPWMAISLSQFGKLSGVNVSQLMNQATSNSPLTETQMFAAATSVRQVGTGSMGGVPVTEYQGTFPLSKALSYLSASARPQVQQEMSQLGFTTENFTVWIDGQHITRKATVTVNGTSVTETVNLTVTGINKPVNITAPPASQTGPLPSSLGSGSSGGLS